MPFFMKLEKFANTSKFQTKLKMKELVQTIQQLSAVFKLKTNETIVTNFIIILPK